MTYKKTNNGYIIRLFQNEKIIESLTAFCIENDIESGQLEGLGAVSSATMGYYDLKQKQYHFTTYDEVIYELISMTGNVALVDSKPFLHIHAAIAGQDLNVLGGHVQEMTVGVTVEVFLTVNDGSITRELDEGIGLKLMQLSDTCASLTDMDL